MYADQIFTLLYVQYCDIITDMSNKWLVKNRSKTLSHISDYLQSLSVISKVINNESYAYMLPLMLDVVFQFDDKYNQFLKYPKDSNKTNEKLIGVQKDLKNMINDIEGIEEARKQMSELLKEYDSLYSKLFAYSTMLNEL